MTNDNYIAFISYRHMPLDTTVATRLHRLIEHYRIPKELRNHGQKHPGRVFRDRDELPLSSDLTHELCSALDRAQFLIVVCTPDTPDSIWVDREIEYFLHSHDRDHVLAVLADGTQEQSFPRRLTEIYAPDNVTVVGQVEPLAANISDATNPSTPADRVLPHQSRVLRRLQGEFLRLVAALLHCPYDTLRQRQKQYQQRQRLTATAAVAAVSLTFAGVVLDRNREIRHQMELAQANEQRALQNEQRAIENEQLAVENARQAQENESSALTLLSRQQLADGDRIGALQNALAAVPKPGDDRPYLTESEKALADALYAYQPQALRSAYTIELGASIGQMLLSEDGSRLILLDTSRNLHCYDTDSGALLWQYNDLGYPSLSELSLTSDGKELLFATTISYCRIDLATGALVTEYGFDERDIQSNFTEYYIFSPNKNAFSPDGQSLLSLVELHVSNNYLLMIRDTMTGEVRAITELPIEMQSYNKYKDIDEWIYFSPDGAYWAVIIQKNDTSNESDPYLSFVFMGDMENGMLLNHVQLDNQLLRYLTCTFTQKNDFLILGMEGHYTEDTVWVGRYSLDSPEPLYSMSSTLGINVPSRSESFLILSTSSFWIIGNNVFRLDPRNGILQHNRTLSNAACYVLREPSGDYFYIIQQNGDIILSSYYSRNGDPQLNTGFSVSAAASANWDAKTFCLVPKEEPNHVVVYKVLGDSHGTAFPDLSDIKLNKNALFYSLSKSSQLTIASNDYPDFPFVLCSADDFTDATIYYPDKHLFDLTLAGISTDNKRLLFTALLPSYVIVDTESRKIGSLQDTLPEDLRSGYYEYKTSSPLSDFGVPLTVWGHKYSWVSNLPLLYWSDLGELKQVFRPQNLEAQAAYRSDDILVAGNNGWFVYGVHDRIVTTTLCAYSIYKENMQILNTEGCNLLSPQISLADINPWCILLDYTGLCRLYDLETGDFRELKLPDLVAGDVLTMRFADEDRLLLIFQENGTLRILRTEDGSQVLTVYLTGMTTDYVPLLQMDTAENDLYIADSSGSLTGLCLDLDSMQIKAEIPGLICFIPATRQLLCHDPDNALPVIYPIYTLEELVTQAQDLLGIS